MGDFGSLRRELRLFASKKKAIVLQRFFKTGPGEYAEGDIFLGVTVPDARRIARRHLGLKLKEVLVLLRSKIHEERLAALLIMLEKFNQEEDKIYKAYLRNLKYVNNWDLVDLSADKIAGRHLINRPKQDLYKLARSKNVWARRVAMIATFYFIKNNQFQDAFKIARILLQDKHDLIHKAAGWMLREVGKRDFGAEEKFLRRHYKAMPRTMLRYAIEKFPESKRKQYLA
ncbi:MAG: DNA alkylation repair protein [Candidatus Wildermuthbacteria bacterium RIFCSPLOWO2_12_FULL_40_9]|uniref:DNA alkylation repair protein n=2 Tax=Candidatus Wildermuthiibacteriota TaxID=1817923 RepID=A0A1G2RDH6_9BACT|nr:MAG: DNA alkylation repair protein [Candidatus Wildermuthbacteria bacterium RIFCSPHIGHO2_12_FULL_40_12]OHA76805.1 MAG: DNA alkylation repair protein [Candidatus Wildermuthbacteria bacterium RIFCSPLOWO2_12_FULL_40_9]